VKLWKNEFFWVSANVLPLPSFHRDSTALIIDFVLRDESISLSHVQLITSIMTHIHPLKEGVLVLGWLSGNWPAHRLFHRSFLKELVCLYLFAFVICLFC
jgi:hypothetical protein